MLLTYQNRVSKGVDMHCQGTYYFSKRGSTVYRGPYIQILDPEIKVMFRGLQFPYIDPPGVGNL